MTDSRYHGSLVRDLVRAVRRQRWSPDRWWGSDEREEREAAKDCLRRLHREALLSADDELVDRVITRREPEAYREVLSRCAEMDAKSSESVDITEERAIESDSGPAPDSPDSPVSPVARLQQLHDLGYCTGIENETCCAELKRALSETSERDHLVHEQLARATANAMCRSCEDDPPPECASVRETTAEALRRGAHASAKATATAIDGAVVDGMERARHMADAMQSIDLTDAVRRVANKIMPWKRILGLGMLLAAVHRMPRTATLSALSLALYSYAKTGSDTDRRDVSRLCALVPNASLRSKCERLLGPTGG